MFERFTGQARQSVQLAQDEARRLRASHIGPEHLLLGIAGVEGPGGPGARVPTGSLSTYSASGSRSSRTTGSTLMRWRRSASISSRCGPPPRPASARAPWTRARPPAKPGHIPFSKEAKKVLELALREAMRLKSGEIGTGHLLLGLLRAGEGPRCRCSSRAASTSTPCARRHSADGRPRRLIRSGRPITRLPSCATWLAVGLEYAGRFITPPTDRQVLLTDRQGGAGVCRLLCSSRAGGSEAAFPSSLRWPPC